MAKIKSSLKNMALSLSLISVGMSAALGFVYSKTKGPIEESQKKKVETAIRSVITDFDKTDIVSVLPDDGADSVVLYIASKGGNPAGAAVKTYTDKGFSGRFSLMVGFLPDGSISDIMVLDQKETPGLGSKMNEPKFKDQFKGLNLASLPGNKLSVKKDGGSIDAITASTITSRAFCDAVNRAYACYVKRPGAAPEKAVEDAPADTFNISDEAVIAEVLPAYDNQPMQGKKEIENAEVYTATLGGKTSGIAVKAYGNGYNGSIWLLVGFLPDGTINKIKVLSQKESKGKGSQIADKEFISQFEGKNPGKDKLLLKDQGGAIDAISSATISCEAFCKAVANAWAAFQKGGAK